MVVEEWIVGGKRIVQVASHVSEDRVKKLKGICKAVWRTIAARPGVRFIYNVIVEDIANVTAPSISNLTA